MRRVLLSLTIVLALGSLTVSTALAKSGNPPNPPPFPTDKSPCAVDFQGITVSAPVGEYVQVDYAFDEKCHPRLVAIKRGSLPIPDDNQDPIGAQNTNTQGDMVLPRTASPLGAGFPLLATGTNSCHTQTYETDFAFIKTVETENDTTYTWNGISITSWYGSAAAYPFFYWWYITSGPTFTATWTVYPTNLQTKGVASYICNGGSFCPNGPMYPITLNAYVNVDKNGGCSGNGTYSGTVIPGGHVLYYNWKD